jgi:hypothetical protein
MEFEFDIMVISYRLSAHEASLEWRQGCISVYWAAVSGS